MAISVHAESLYIVDVRPPLAFAGGHADGAINVPLQEIVARIAELQRIRGEIILCCGHGLKSKIAYRILRYYGFTNVIDGGPWKYVQDQIEKLKGER